MSPQVDAGYRRLIDDLVERGVITPAWEPAFRQAPRGHFVPDVIWHGPRADRGVDRRSDPDGWARLVARDMPLTTKRDEAGTPVSSCSMPFMVATMLVRLDAPDIRRVLEIGTGTGWNAALLSLGYGQQNVTSIESDPRTAAAAAASLAGLGLRPHLLVGDGSTGAAPDKPFDAIIATCAVARVPESWCQQVRPGGVILTPFGSPFRNGCLLRLVVTDDGKAIGRFVEDASFMWMGPAGGPGDVMAHVEHGEAAADTTTDLDPRHVLDHDAAHAIGLLLPDVWRSVGRGQGRESGELTLWLADPVTRSWAAIDYQPGRAVFEVTHYGPRQLQNELRAAYHWWHCAGQPNRFRFGLTVDPSGQRAWLDSPDRPVPTQPGAGRVDSAPWASQEG